MKQLKTVLLLLMLIGLPLISWYFLKSGLEWRKEKVSDLKAKELFMRSFDFSNADKDALYEMMAHRTAVVKLSDAINENDEKLIDQFDNAYTFQFISFEKTENMSKGWNSKSVVRYFKPSSQNCTIAEMQGSKYMIVDTTGMIRQFYKDDSEKSLGTMIEDLAVILPRKKAKDIVIKNQEQ